jgi:hypothetical protein
MSVHVGEVHTEVVPAAPASAGGSGREQAPERLGAAEEAWSEARRNAAMRSCRTAAEGFDD